MSEDDYVDIMDELDVVTDDLATITVQILVLVVYDASGSMSEIGTSGKAKFMEAQEATNGFIQRLKESRIENSFRLGVAVFNDRVHEVLEPVPVSELPVEDAITLPNPHGATNIDAGLEWAEQKAEEFMQNEGEHSLDKGSKKVAIVVISDGHHNRGQDPLPRGKNLANRYTLGAGAFGDAAEEVLKNIVTTPQLFKKDPTPEELRQLIEVSSTIAAATP